MDGYEELEDLLADVLNDEAYRRHKTWRERVGGFMLRATLPHEFSFSTRTKERVGLVVIGASALAINQGIEKFTGVNPALWLISTVAIEGQ